MINLRLFCNFQRNFFPRSCLVCFLPARNQSIFRSYSRFRQTPSLSVVTLRINRHLSPAVLKRVTSAFEFTGERRKNTLATMADQKKPFERLPKDVVPSKYCIRLQPNLKTFTFEGSEEINVEVKKSVNSITLNLADITVKEAAYCADGGGNSAQNAEISYSAEDETVKFTFPSTLQTGTGSLKIAFTGELNDKMKGFYRSVYKGPDGEECVSAVTQFEATDARRAFPCWDEPATKAVFDITLVVPKEKVALSNMPVKKESVFEEDPTQKVVVYKSTPIMSTYLVAFVVGNYDYVEKKDADGVLIRVYTPAGKKEQGQFALDVAVKTLPFYKKYFGISYPLPKIDLIAIADFAAGAMENWGLVTYRETALLVDPQNTSSRVKQWVALVVGHELAHQWFGNLVTMEWWTHLWLNEGFASWIEYLCVDHCFPEYDIWTQFVNNDLGRALELDALHNSHPIEVPVGHPSEVDEIFDAISYSKGASVIRMLHSYIGDKDFCKGMNHYLTTHQYKNAFTEDLWASLEKASGKPVGDIMTTWTKQMGFPVLKVTEKQEGNKRELTIVQEKFCADGKLPKGDASQWLVPVSIVTSSSPNKPVRTVLLDKPSVTVTLDNVKAGDWVKLNAGSVGVYRVQYPPKMLAALIPAIKSKVLPSRDRLGLQNDLFALARADLMPMAEVLKVVQAFDEETDFTVWTDLNGNLSVVALLMQYTDHYEKFKAFCRKLFGNTARKLGWDPKEGEGHLDNLLRELMISRMGRYGDADFLAEARKRFEAHVTGESELPADLRAAVYGTVLTHGDESTYEKMLKLYDAADMQEEKVRISRSLGCVKDEALIQKVLNFALSDKVRSQDTVFVIGGTTGSVKGRELVWRFTRDNWSTLHSRYKGGFLLARLVKSTTENFATEEKAAEVDKFYKDHPAPAAERTVQQSIENIRLNACFLAKDAAEVGNFLAGQ